MFTVVLQVTDTGLIDAYKQILQSDAAAAAFVKQSTERDVTNAAAALQKDLSTAPGPVVYPIRWTSARQRRAFFATNGFGKGIPYKRTGQFVKGWRVQVNYAPAALATVSADNPAPARPYVTGAQQQMFHAITGWRPEELVFEYHAGQMMAAVENSLIRGFYAVG